ncbi:MAG: adenosylcobinamide-GDP ribazoletransferase [Novosphingobium pentaromativorans]|uniref:Adenosylcobinamide-GDP ribazoletransferase n=1 Tax=Novosphingobium pentaromativorans TaxID=205844 RepID=A0A2W5NFC8_9SPHN|nr:adenosylcobinamide-GDP ribazoletransferase [Novosphingobium panipatense]PZQ50919.1 MAG: adenosylcobinamide-GDP ribazoletransferase [Novosphingobium pentaromativorans]
MRGLVLALQFLTRLPLPAVRADGADFAKSMRWFPVAGLAVGGVVAGGWWLGGFLGDRWLAALLGLAAWVGVTGALHLDGLGDVADGAGAAHKDRARLSAVMADPHLGSFAVVAIGLQLLAKLVLLHALEPGQVWALLLVAPLARIAPLAWTLALPPLHEGLGSRFRSAVNGWHPGLWGIVAMALGLLVAPPLLALFLAVPAWGYWLHRKIGGISGDGHGAGIEVVETLLLLALVILR